MPADETADDAPIADDEAADDADMHYQRGFDDASDARRWIKSALEVLTAEVAGAPDGSLEARELASARTEASRLIARVCRSIAPDS